MTRPFASLVFAYCAGLLLAWLAHPPLASLFAVAAGILLVALFLKKLRPFLVWPLLALLGCANFEYRTTVILPADLRTQIGAQPALVSVRGTLLATPDLRIYLRDELMVKRSVASVRVTELYRDGVWHPAMGDIVATVPGVLGETYFTGQPVEIGGVIDRPALPAAPGIFDYRAYLEKLGIYYTLKVHSTNEWALGKDASPQPPFSAHFIAWANRVLTIGLDPTDESTQLLLAMTLGQKTALNDEVSEPFMRSGTMHIFAISGLHIALIAGILIALLRVAQVPRGACGLIVLPLIWFYTAATGWQPSAIRSTIMMSVIIGGWSLKRPSNLLNSLSAAGFIILLWDPQQLFQASFQLSFFVVLSIALFSPPLEALRDRLLQTDPLLPRELLSRPRRWLDSLLRGLATSLTTSLAAWLGSLPLTAYYFHLFSPVTLLANLVIVPLSGVALMANLGSLLCGTWFPFGTELFNNAAWFAMWLMVHGSEWFTKIPGGWMYLPTPPLILIALYFILLIGFTSGWLLVKTRRTVTIVLLFLLGLTGIGYWQLHRGQIELTVLPLNGGHAAYVDADGRANDWLINCGNKDAVEFTLKDHLRAQGVNRIPRLVLTEGATRYCGGAQSLDQLFGVGELWTGTTHFRSPIYRQVVAAYQRRQKFMNYGDTIGPWQVLFPDTINTLAKAADKPLVLRGDFAGTKILLLSDLSRPSQSDLLSDTNLDLHADIVITGIPEEGEPLCNALIAAVQPKVIVIADSDLPAQYRATAALKARLKQTKTPVLYTRDAGAIKISLNKTGWKLKAMDGQTFEDGKTRQN